MLCPYFFVPLCLREMRNNYLYRSLFTILCNSVEKTPFGNFEMTGINSIELFSISG